MNAHEKEIRADIKAIVERISDEVNRAIIGLGAQSSMSCDDETRRRCRLIINSLLGAFGSFDSETAEAIRLIRADRWDIELNKNEK